MELGYIIAWNLKKLRRQRNVTQGQLAKAAGVSKAMVSEIEKGGSNPTINTLWKLAKGLCAAMSRGKMPVPVPRSSHLASLGAWAK